MYHGLLAGQIVPINLIDLINRNNLPFPIPWTAKARIEPSQICSTLRSWTTP